MTFHQREAARAKIRRDYLRAVKLCICGPTNADLEVGIRGATHGPVYKGGRCERCWMVKKS